MEKKYTKDGLPVISEEVVKTFIRDYNQRKSEGYQSMDRYASELVEKIFKKENPNLILFLEEMEKEHLKKSEETAGFFFGLAAMYDLFRRQGETNKLEEVNNR